MRIVMLGSGQCGTCVGHDLVAKLVGVPRASVLENTMGAGTLTRTRSRAERWFAESTELIKHNFRLLTTGYRIAHFPELFVVDRNGDNHLLSGIAGSTEYATHLAKLDVHVRAVPVEPQGGACAHNAVGELFYSKYGGSLLKNDPVDNSLRKSEVIAFAFSAAGGSGAGAAISLPRQLALKSKIYPGLRIGLAVLPPIATTDSKESWNTGRALYWLLTDIPTGGLGALVLFSNLSAEGAEKDATNDYIASFLLRLANVSFDGVAAAWGRSCDAAELKAFMMGDRPLVVGLASGHASESLSELVRRALSPRKKGSAVPEGLSVELPECDALAVQVGQVSVWVGVPNGWNVPLSAEREISEAIKECLSPNVEIRQYSHKMTGAEELQVTLMLKPGRRWSFDVLSAFYARYFDPVRKIARQLHGESDDPLEPEKYLNRMSEWDLLTAAIEDGTLTDRERDMLDEYRGRLEDELRGADLERKDAEDLFKTRKFHGKFEARRHIRVVP